MRGLQAARGTSLSVHARRGRLGLVLLVAAVIVLLDQLIKVAAVEWLEGRDPVVIIDGVLQLRVLRNFGAAFSFGSGMTLVFTGVAVVVTVVVLRTARTLTSTLWALALAALLGGAVGNLIDRLVRSPQGGQGGVVDYLDVPWFSVFNLADVSLTMAAIGVALLALTGVPMSEPDGPPVPDASGEDILGE